MESLQGVDPNLEILLVLDSPQLQGLAPELVPYRDRVAAIGGRLEGAKCGSCARRKMNRQLTKLAAELAQKIFSTPELHAVLDALMTSSLQAQEVTNVAAE